MCLNKFEIKSKFSLKGRMFVKVKCYCGTVFTTRLTDIKSGHTKSCGCLFKKGNNTKHNHAKKNRESRTYKSWRCMKYRCNNPHYHQHNLYGGRGIKVCDRWLDFNNFLKDMGERPKNKTLDRIDNDGNYEPDNCRWATPKQQVYNRRGYGLA